MTKDTDTDRDEQIANNMASEGQKGGNGLSQAPAVTIDDCVTARAQILIAQNDIQKFVEEQRDKIGSTLQRWESISLEDLDDPLREQVKTTQSELRSAYRQLGGQQ